MRPKLIYFLAVGVPGLCFLVAGFVNREYTVAALGGILVIVFVYGLSQKSMAVDLASDQKRQRLSLVLAGIIGASLAVSGFASPRYWLAAVGIVILIGSLFRLYRATLSNGR